MSMQKIGYYVSLVVIAVLALAMVGCEQKTINQIKADPGRYANRDVTVVGSVVRSYSVLGKGLYEIDDGTGKLWVVSAKSVPREGAKVAVQGTIRDAYNFGSLGKLPEALSSGLAMIEKSHKAK
jgi:hypothetical protein